MYARSSAETEYHAMAMDVTKLLWLKILLKDLRMVIYEPMHLYCDKKTTINFMNNYVLHDRIKYIEINRHFIK